MNLKKNQFMQYMEDHKEQQSKEFDPVTNDRYMAGHDYDGIRELSNEPPYWLSFIFIISVLFAYTYMAKYHIFKSGDLQEEKYRKEMAVFAGEEDQAGKLMVMRPAETGGSLGPLTLEADLTAGKDIFRINCVVCHLSEGQGLVGPNLTDEFWIHGGSYSDIVNLIIEGVPAKGMISWKTQISQEQIHQVASYILTLQGTNPPNPKPPEGEKYVSE
jgi:cytochrome c oxidase cbb3-type subunit 3